MFASLAFKQTLKMPKIQQLMCSDLNHHMESAFLFTHNSLRPITYVKKRKEARIEEKQTLNVTFDSWFFNLILKWNS